MCNDAAKRKTSPLELLCCPEQGRNQLFISVGANSFDDVIVLIQPWYNFFPNGRR